MGNRPDEPGPGGRSALGIIVAAVAVVACCVAPLVIVGYGAALVAPLALISSWAWLLGTGAVIALAVAVALRRRRFQRGMDND